MEGGTATWELIESSGTIPPPISHHSGTISQDTFLVYGGLVGSDSNAKLYALDMKTFRWSVVEEP